MNKDNVLKIVKNPVFKNTMYFDYVGLIILFSILGIADQISGFVLRSSNPIGVGTLSIFGFIAMILILLFIVYKIAQLIKNKKPVTPTKE